MRNGQLGQLHIVTTTTAGFRKLLILFGKQMVNGPLILNNFEASPNISPYKINKITIRYFIWRNIW
jgi:hypothetical protein